MAEIVVEPLGLKAKAPSSKQKTHSADSYLRSEQTGDFAEAIKI